VCRTSSFSGSFVSSGKGAEGRLVSDILKRLEKILNLFDFIFTEIERRNVTI
jgi:hypothetical protein